MISRMKVLMSGRMAALSREMHLAGHWDNQATPMGHKIVWLCSKIQISGENCNLMLPYGCEMQPRPQSHTSSGKNTKFHSYRAFHGHHWLQYKYFIECLLDY